MSFIDQCCAVSSTNTHGASIIVSVINKISDRWMDLWFSFWKNLLKFHRRIIRVWVLLLLFLSLNRTTCSSCSTCSFDFLARRRPRSIHLWSRLLNLRHLFQLNIARRIFVCWSAKLISVWRVLDGRSLLSITSLRYLRKRSNLERRWSGVMKTSKDLWWIAALFHHSRHVMLSWWRRWRWQRTIVNSIWFTNIPIRFTPSLSSSFVLNSFKMTMLNLITVFFPATHTSVRLKVYCFRR